LTTIWTKLATSADPCFWILHSTFCCKYLCNIQTTKQLTLLTSFSITLP